MVRAKFQLAEITLLAYGDAKKLKFTAQYDQTIPEDLRFQKASPWGQFEIIIDNPAALSYFKLGNYYYFDATEVPPKVKEPTAAEVSAAAAA